MTLLILTSNTCIG